MDCATLMKEETKRKHYEESMVERGAQVSSVLRILRESIEKLKVSLMLPVMLDNMKILRHHLQDSEYRECVELAGAFVKEYRKLQETSEGSTHKLNYKLIKLIDVFHENFKLMEHVPQWMQQLDPDDEKLLDAFNLLRDIAENRLQKSATTELNAERQIHELFHENELIKKSIAEYEHRLHNQKVNLRWKFASKDGVIHKLEEDLAHKKWDNNLRIRREIVNSTKQIRSIQVNTAQKQKELTEELEKTKESYHKVLKQDLKQEKEARDEKNKLLIQLQTLIRKYDQNIADKIKENMYLDETFALQKQQFNEFLVEFKKEEEQYDSIVRVKEELERQKHEEKIMLFIMNRAAKVIQRFWRKFMTAQKKAAKGKKGKKK